MDAELKAKWIEALRSGEYEQARATLRDGDRYCCLGVLCVVAGLGFTSDGSGIDRPGSYVPLVPILGDKLKLRELYRLNDTKRASFPEIAEYIEANL